MQLREAGPEDADALTDCEEAAYGTGLAHVFGDLPWPRDGIRRRWVAELADPGVTTLVVDLVGDEDREGVVIHAADR
ncbi:hypothetical protein KV102_05620 [Mumia sp. zg.B53]|uniref:hypothetical protein n=1 Tax=unclassified Mumia TaxID=2621872 RepID=UPI001C6E20EF|nr:MULTISPECIES: hypothetical protein [unclassified Mumia]MBW9209712.1 hypothetical protein [Mumia sp. zg.B21]MBW9214316.1 hypothetical protein [Mumia sp. zg.B53]